MIKRLVKTAFGTNLLFLGGGSRTGQQNNVAFRVFGVTASFFFDRSIISRVVRSEWEEQSYLDGPFLTSLLQR